MANVHADGTVTLNTPQSSFDRQRDLGLTIFLIGIGPFPDRTDGAAWPFNPGDNQKAQLGVSPLTQGTNRYYAYSQAGLFIVAQGAKRVILGRDVCEYDASQPHDKNEVWFRWAGADNIGRNKNVGRINHDMQ